LAAVGHEVRDNSTEGVSASLFAGSFTGAIEGNETSACEEEATALREASIERRRRA
jgi:hypothetical protein